MYTTIMPEAPPRSTIPLDPILLAQVVPVTDPDLYARVLDGETDLERRARLEAAAHITEDLLAEAAETAIDRFETEVSA